MEPIVELKQVCMQLSQKAIKKISPKPGLVMPGDKLFSLPEKVLQFGTGILLRGLPDFFIDKANKRNIFDGSILVVKSTAGGVDDFDEAKGRFETFIRGIENGKKIEETILNESISRVLSAVDHWPVILEAAGNT